MNIKNLLLSLLLLTSCSFNRGKGTELPSIDLLLRDSVTIFSTDKIPKGQSILLVYFSPDCESCQKETEELLENHRKLRDTRIYFLTAASFSELTIFDKHYQLYKYANITLGQDYKNYFNKYFNPTGTPFMVIYNKEKKLSAIFSGSTKMTKVIEIIQSIK